MLDRSISIFGILTTSVPEFASAVIFSALFVFGLKWLPGTSSMSGGFEFRQLILPVMVLVVYDFGYVVAVFGSGSVLLHVLNIRLCKPSSTENRKNLTTF